MQRHTGKGGEWLWEGEVRVVQVQRQQGAQGHEGSEEHRVAQGWYEAQGCSGDAQHKVTVAARSTGFCKSGMKHRPSVGWSWDGMWAVDLEPLALRCGHGMGCGLFI